MDVVTYHEDNSLRVTLYTKKHDTKSFLDYGSCHPVHVKNSIPQSQVLRISTWFEFIKNSIKLYIALNRRGYPFDLLHKALCQVNKKTQDQALISNKQPSENALFLVVDYNPNNPDLHNILQKYWNIMDRSSSTRSLLDYNIVISYKKPKSLMDLLCTSDIRKTKKINSLRTFCPRPGKFKHCQRLNKTGTIISASTGRKYKTLRTIFCRSSNLIYCLECTTCHAQYVGQTKNQLRIRMNNHLSTITTKGDTPVAQHFNKHPNFNITILQLIREIPNINSQDSRNRWENNRIARLNTIVPHRLNIMD